MDITHFKHRAYKPSLLVAFLLAVLVVAAAAFLGRSTLNLHGALLLPEPHDTTVIALIEPGLEKDITITKIEFLRKEKAVTIDDKPRYSYTVQTSDGAQFFLQLAFDRTKGEWKIWSKETLHGN